MFHAVKYCNPSENLTTHSKLINFIAFIKHYVRISAAAFSPETWKETPFSKLRFFKPGPEWLNPVISDLLTEIFRQKNRTRLIYF